MIANYTELKEAVSRFAMREGDADFEGSVPDFIKLAESRLNRVLPLRVMEVDANLVGTIGSRLVPLPDDFVEPFALHLTTFGEREMRGPGIAGQMRINSANGTPEHWCINGANIELDTSCDQAHTFVFRYRKSFALSDAEPTNWLLTNHPDAYLAACIVWGGVFMQDQQQAAAHKALLEEAISEISWKEARSIAIAPLRVDPALVSGGGFNIISG